MKLITKNSQLARALAIILSVVMLITTLNLSTILSVFALPENTAFTVIVKDVSGVPVEGATVTVTPVDGELNIENLQPVATNADGKASFEAITEFFSSNLEVTEFEATYSVTAENFKNEEDTVTVTANGEVSVSLTSTIISSETVTVVPYNNKYDGIGHDAVTVTTTVDGDTVTYSTDGEIFSEQIPQVEIPATLTVYVKVERDGFQPFVNSYDAVVSNAVLTDSDIVITPYNDVYDGEPHEAVSVSGTIAGDLVLYSTDGGVEWKSDVPMVEIPVVDSEVKIKVQRQYYDDYYTTAKATVSPAEIEGIVVTPYSGTYDEQEHDAISLIEGKTDGDIVEYSLTGGNDYSSECPKVKDANGEGLTVYVRIKRNYHNDYISFPTGFKAVVSKADFEVSATPYVGKYDKNEHDIITGSITGLEDGDAITYSRERDGSYTDEPFKVKNVTDSGSYYIKVSRDDNYNDQIIEVSVVITASEQEITFENVPVSVNYNESNTFCYQIAVFSADETGSREITYEIVADNTQNNNAEIQADGTVTYWSVGNITVKASVPATDNYQAADTTYTIEIKYINAPQLIMTEPKYENNGIKWYNTDVVLSAESYKIIENDNSLHQDTWSESITKTDAVKYDSIKVAFKNDNGDITDLVEVPKFAIDKTDPTIERFEIKEPTVLQKVINFLTFGVFANDNIKVTVEVEDTDVSAGIKEIVLYANGVKLDVTPEYGQDKKTATFKVPAEEITENKRLDVVLSAQVEDNVTNKSAETQMTTENSNLGTSNSTLLIETINPIIDNFGDVAINPNTTNKDGAIYNGDFNFSFDVVDPDSGLYSVDVKVNGNSYNGYPKSYFEIDSATITKQSYVISTVGLTPDENGAFKFDIIATDCAGNQVSSETKTIYKDLTAPIISKFRVTYSDNENGVTVEKDLTNEALNNNVVQVTDYGYYFNEDVKIYITAKDIASTNEAASGVAEIVYEAVDIENGVAYRGFENVDENGTISFIIEKDFKGQIYAYAIDNVGNSSINGNEFFSNGQNEYNPDDYNTELVTDGTYKGYVHPNGSIVEGIQKHKTTSAITITAPEKIDTQNNSFAFTYTGDAETLDSVKDYDDSQKVPLYKSKDGIVFKIDVEDTYSGIRSVKWTAFEGEGGAIASSNTVSVNNKGELGGEKEGWSVSDGLNADNLVYKLSTELTIKGNHNNMVLLIELTDRAGNTSYDYYVFGIDTTLPTIDVQYNVDDSEKNDETYTDYFRTNRKATIVITERNFRAQNVDFTITKDGNPVSIVNLKDSSVWKEKIDEDDLDNTTYTTTIDYVADGDYTFEISCTDNAENKNEPVDFGESIAPTKFTIDKTLPTVTVEYDNNSAMNGNYYKADRVATITITEHNFDTSRVKILEEVPALSAWKSNGNVHTATISYTTDGKYTFDIVVTDKAGNIYDDYEVKEFYIDKTNPSVSISGVADNSANKSEGNIGFTVTATDDNFDVFTPVLSVVLMKDGKFESKNLTVGSTENITNGQKYAVTNLDTDGIYSVTCTVVDKAGNAFSEVILEDANGKSYVENRSGNDKLITFSVNRNGSVFSLDTYTGELVKTYYVKNVTENVTIIEINPDRILENTVTLNGKTLVENTDYSVNLENAVGSWYKYSYSINKSLFDGESEYVIVVSSKDKATNTAFSDVKDASVKFVVDRTAPIVTVAGLKTNGRYQVDKQVVTLIPTDDGGLLKSLVVRTVDENGKTLKELINMSGDELLDAIASGNITFELSEGLYQNVQIICEDCAGNIVGAETDEIYSNVSISSSAFLIFWANKPLRWGSIGGVVALSGAIAALAIIKKRKKGVISK